MMLKKKYFVENGVWGLWGFYGICLKICGIGIKIRIRICDNFVFIGNGVVCLGFLSDDVDCNI